MAKRKKKIDHRGSDRDLCFINLANTELPEKGIVKDDLGNEIDCKVWNERLEKYRA